MPETTHWVGCYRAHRACAVALIEQIQSVIGLDATPASEVDRLRRQVAAADMLAEKASSFPHSRDCPADPTFGDSYGQCRCLRLGLDNALVAYHASKKGSS